MISDERLRSTVQPVVDLFPRPYFDAADINEALDTGTGSCAVRSFAGGLLLRGEFTDPTLYEISFGFAPEHGKIFEGANGKFVTMGHAVTRFQVPGATERIIETYKNATLEITGLDSEHHGYCWYGLEEGYRRYLDVAGLDEVQFDTSDILQCMINRIRTKR